MADEGQTSAQFAKSPKGPRIDVEEVGEANASTPPTTINKHTSP